jgi:16S rRNA (guanine527-N7)-methyltransferase
VTVQLDADALLDQGLQLLDVPDPGPVAEKLRAFLSELERWNPRFGLVNAAGRGELVVKHVLDSLAGWRAVRDAAGPGGSVLDVGSGAGFPGIPLAVALPGLSFTLLERMARRVAFLKTCAVLIPLPRATVVQADLGAARGSFDVVTFRAVAPLSRFLQSMPGAAELRWQTIVAYKGREVRAREEAEAVRCLLGEDEAATVTAVRVPFLDEERCLAVLSHRHHP